LWSILVPDPRAGLLAGGSDRKNLGFSDVFRRFQALSRRREPPPIPDDGAENNTLFTIVIPDVDPPAVVWTNLFRSFAAQPVGASFVDFLSITVDRGRS
jgi:hypothetical protein